VGGSNDTVAEIDEKITDELDRAEKGLKKDTLELLEEGNYKSGIPPTLSDMEKGRAGYSKGGKKSRRHSRRRGHGKKTKRIRKRN
jgi:hypothetical protein